MASKEKTLTAYKGFNDDFTCRDFQYEVGKTYEHEGDVKACRSGFHACEYPLDVLQYYSPGSSRFAIVKQSGEMSRDSDDSKVSSAKISIEAEINLSQLIEDAVAFIVRRAKKLKTSHSKADNSHASNSGDYGAASNSGYGGAASNSGYGGAASNSGNRGAASNSGYGGAASNSGYGGAASNSGDYGAASNSGYGGAASNSGNRGAAMHSGYGGKVKGSDGSALFLVERNDDYEIINVWSGIVGKEGVKPDTWYSLKDGELIAAMSK